MREIASLLTSSSTNSFSEVIQPDSIPQSLQCLITIGKQKCQVFQHKQQLEPLYSRKPCPVTGPLSLSTSTKGESTTRTPLVAQIYLSRLGITNYTEDESHPGIDLDLNHKQNKLYHQIPNTFRGFHPKRS